MLCCNNIYHWSKVASTSVDRQAYLAFSQINKRHSLLFYSKIITHKKLLLSKSLLFSVLPIAKYFLGFKEKKDSNCFRQCEFEMITEITWQILKKRQRQRKFKTDLVNILAVLTTEVKVLNDINVNDPI